MDAGIDLIGMFKTNTKVLCNNTNEKLTKYWPRDSYPLLISKPMVPGGRPLIYICYKYNMRKVISFIATDNAGSTKSGLNYLYK